MANKKYYTTETIEFQNGDKTIAKPLTLKKLRAFSEVWNDYTESLQKSVRYMEEIRDEAIKNGDKTPDVSKIFEAKEKAGEVPEELTNAPTYLDTLAQCSLIALTRWGVTTSKEKAVEVDMDYVEEELDADTMTRICEVAGSMKLGDISDDVEGKARTE